MGITLHNYVSPYSFVMGVVWFTAFILLGLLMRKAKYPIIFSVVPLLLLLVLGVLRMFIMVNVPFVVVVRSETIYPAIVNFFRLVIVPPVTITHVLIFAWVAVAVWLTVRYAHDYISKYHHLMKWWVTLPRDEHAESLLREVIGNDKKFRILRSAAFSTAVATAIRPYIILPEVDFTDDELQVILLHEWKHIQDKDYLTDILIELISFVFWWNPVVYLLKRNFDFAAELKCDGYAVSNKKDFHHLLDGLVKIDSARKEKARSLNAGNALSGRTADFVDRLTTMAMRCEKSSRKRRLLTNVGCSVLIICLFFGSYAFVVQPSVASPYAPVTGENFHWEDRERGDVFNMAELEIYVIDNDDGTFSYYINGVFIMYLDYGHDFLQWVEIRTRESS